MDTYDPSKWKLQGANIEVDDNILLILDLYEWKKKKEREREVLEIDRSTINSRENSKVKRIAFC